MVAVIGGGPAGSATALSLARRGVRDVVMFDSGDDTDRGDVIGECIPPAATPLLRDLGVLEQVDRGPHLPCPGSKSLWDSPHPGFNDFLFDPFGKGYHLDRRVFDTQMRAAVADAGVEVRRGVTLRAVRERGIGLELTTIGPGSWRDTHRVAFAVDATGTRFALARRLGVARNVLDRLIAVNALIDVEAGAFPVERTLLEAVEYGWWYAARLPRGRMILSLFTDPQTLVRRGLHGAPVWSAAFGRTRLMRREIDASLVASVGNLVVREAPTVILSGVAGGSWLAVGDAASAYDPIGTAGITKALAHGIAAADAIEAHLADGRDAARTVSLAAYQRRVFADFTTHVKLRRGLYAAVSRWPGALFWSRRVRLGGPGGARPLATALPSVRRSALWAQPQGS